MSFIDDLKKENNYTETENGALTLKSSTNKLVDFFALGGAFRSRSDNDLITLFHAAYNENANDAIKVLFYLRDVRGGQGERKVFRTLLTHIGTNIQISKRKELFDYVVEYGRYDDLYSFVGTLLESDMFTYMEEQINEDAKSEYPSLLAKWLKSPSTHSKINRLGVLTAKRFGLTLKAYRKLLTISRAKLNLIETKLTNKEYNIDYAKVPSKAMMQYRKAFERNDKSKFDAYLDSVSKGEAKINTSTLMPHEIYQKCRTEGFNATIEALWANQTDWVADNGNALVMADVSGSMVAGKVVKPLDVSVSLALYQAERNKGTFKDYFMTFSGNPELVQVKGKTLLDKFLSISRANWEMNTNLQAAFDLILRTAVNNSTPAEDMPKVLYIISDMEFDEATSSHSRKKTNFEVAKENFCKAGYELPRIVFWNVAARNSQVPVTQDERGVTLVSGFSATTFRHAISNTTPYEFMRQVIDGERYNKITLF